MTGSPSSPPREFASSASHATRTGRTERGSRRSVSTRRSSPTGTAPWPSASRRRALSAGWTGCRSDRRSWSTRTVRSAHRGGTRIRRCRTSTCCWKPCGLPRPSGRRLRRSGRGLDVACGARREPELHGRRARGPRRGRPRGSPAGRLPALAAGPSAGERRGAVARPVQLPAGRRVARQLRRVAVRDPVLAARALARRRRRLERLRPPLLRRRGAVRIPLAGVARPGAAAGLRGRAAVRARALSRRAALRRAPARTRLDAPAARALGDRTPVAVARGGRARVDSAVRPGAPRARGDPVRRPLRARSD